MSDNASEATNGADAANGSAPELEWHRVLAADELPEGRVTTVAAGHKSVALVHYDGEFSALDNHCPHQGGPLGEGSIENGLLRCPWHGFDYCPLDGRSPGFDDEAITYPLEIRDGEVCVGVTEPRTSTTVTDLMAETMVNWGVRHVFGMVGHSNLGLADALRRQEEAGQADVHRDPPRGRRRVRGLRLRQADRPARRLPDDRRAGRDEPAHRALGREGRPLAGARADRPGRHAGARPGRVPGGRPRRRVRLGRRWSQPVLRDSKHGRADEPRLQERAAAARRLASDLPRRGADAPGARGRGAGRARGPDHAARRSRRRRSRSPRRSSCSASAKRPVIIVGHGAALRHGRGDRARRAARRAGDHDVQGEGPDRRRPPARGRACSGAAGRRWRAGS